MGAVLGVGQVAEPRAQALAAGGLAGLPGGLLVALPLRLGRRGHPAAHPGGHPVHVGGAADHQQVRGAGESGIGIGHRQAVDGRGGVGPVDAVGDGLGDLPGVAVHALVHDHGVHGCHLSSVLTGRSDGRRSRA